MRAGSHSPGPSDAGPAGPRVAFVRSLAQAHRDQRGPLLPVLHGVIEEFGWIDRPDIEAIADELNLSVADVHGVVSFYEDFRTTPPAAHLVAICRAEACQAVGGRALWDAAQELRTPELEVHQVFCLGNCALGPSGTVDGQLHGRLDADRLASLAGEVRA